MDNAFLDWRHVRENKCVHVHLKMLGLCFDILIIGHKLYGFLESGIVPVSSRTVA